MHALCKVFGAPASMKVTSEPRAVYTSENSSPIYPEPIMAIHLGIQSNFKAWSDVNTCIYNDKQSWLLIRVTAQGKQGMAAYDGMTKVLGDPNMPTLSQLKQTVVHHWSLDIWVLTHRV